MALASTPAKTETSCAVTRLSAHEERRVAVTAGVDPRTVRAFLAHRKLRSTTSARIEEAFRRLNLAHLLEQSPPK